MTHQTTEQMKPEERAVENFSEVRDAAICAVKQYARERPEVVGMWVFGLGFILGWKLKPW